MGPRTMTNQRRRFVAAAATTAAAALVVGACSSHSAAITSRPTKPGTIAAVGAENQYANVISQIGGADVTVTAIMTDPNTDPHTFEASPSVSRVVSRASLIVQNGLGYDDFMSKIEAASPNSKRKVVDVQTLLRVPDSTANPHLWYDPTTMPAVAKAVAVIFPGSSPAMPLIFRPTPPLLWRRCSLGSTPSPSSSRNILAPRWRPPSRWGTICSKRPGPMTLRPSASRPTS